MSYSYLKQFASSASNLHSLQPRVHPITNRETSEPALVSNCKEQATSECVRKKKETFRTVIGQWPMHAFDPTRRPDRWLTHDAWDPTPNHTRWNSYAHCEPFFNCTHSAGKPYCVARAFHVSTSSVNLCTSLSSSSVFSIRLCRDLRAARVLRARFTATVSVSSTLIGGSG